MAHLGKWCKKDRILRFKLDRAPYNVYSELQCVYSTIHQRENMKKQGSLKHMRVAFLKRMQRYIDQLRRLNRLIHHSEIMDDGSIFVRLVNGLEFYGRYGPFSFEFENGYLYRNRVRDKLIGGSDYGSFYHILKEIFIGKDYDIYYPLQRGDTVIDAGANIGLFTIKAGKEVGPEGRVIAIEPDETHLNFLRRNIEANRLTNIEIVPKGVWSEKIERNLYLYDNTGHHSLYSNEEFPKGCKQTGTVKLELDTIDNISGELGCKKVDFIKMDIEGAELEALAGAKEALSSNDVKLAVAAYHRVHGEPTYKTLIPKLQQIGYEVHRIEGTIHARNYLDSTRNS